jgi:RES domain
METATLPGKVVNLLARRAASHFGVTGELFTRSDYSVPQAWAAAIHHAGYDGLVYAPRFTPSGKAIAIFGLHGAHPRPVSHQRPLIGVLEAAGVPVVDIPPASALTYATPTDPGD